MTILKYAYQLVELGYPVKDAIEICRVMAENKDDAAAFVSQKQRELSGCRISER